MYLFDFGREIIIMLLLFFLIHNTNINELKMIYLNVILIHLYKIYRNYDEMYNITLKYKELFLIFTIILLISLHKFINKKNRYFLFLFVIFRIISSKLLEYKRAKPKLNNYYNLIISIILLKMYLMYTKYNYKDIFMMDLINHILLFLKF